MFYFDQLKSAHIEITNRCQASCPMCARNYHSGLPNPLIKDADWSLEDFQQIFTDEVIDQLEGFYFCGNFGDPIINPDFLDMVKWISPKKENLRINVHTNGGARKTDWWIDLAKSLPRDHTVMFGIDGLEDTHHLYRIGTTYENVVRNAKAFIDAGGNAEWVFLKFKHNEHQEEEARQRAKDLGFKTFMLKNSSRFLGEPKYRVLDKQEKTIYFIEPPSDNKMTFISKEVLNNYKSIVENTEIDCKALEQKEIYIDAHKNIFPCCWIASIPYTQYDDDNVNRSLSNEIKKQYQELVTDLGTIEKLNAVTIGIKNVLETSEWQTVWKNYWADKKLIMCARSCGKTEIVSKPHDQFLNRSKLKNFEI
jgi:MoaA/NifB/PqqE/SkfB family radical SAM enzyme